MKKEEPNGCIGNNGVSDPNLNEVQLNQSQQEQEKKLYSDLVDLLERLRPIYKEDSVSHFKCEKQRINIIKQFKNK